MRGGHATGCRSAKYIPDRPQKVHLAPLRDRGMGLAPLLRAAAGLAASQIAAYRSVGESALVEPHRRCSMIRKLKSGEYRLYSRKLDPKSGKRRNLGTFSTRAAAEKHERAVQYFKARG